MIREEEVFRIGKFKKPHGIKGEIAFYFENDIFDKVDCPYIICKVDGIYVPFFVKDYRFKGADIALISLEDVNDDIQAKRFNGLDVYFPREYFNEEEDTEYTFDFFIGFSVIDGQLGNIGVITAVDDATINTLFLINGIENKEIIIPASEDLITSVDIENKLIYFNLPSGLIE